MSKREGSLGIISSIYPGVLVEEMEAQRGDGTCPGSTASWDFWVQLSSFQVHKSFPLCHPSFHSSTSLSLPASSLNSVSVWGGKKILSTCQWTLLTALIIPGILAGWALCSLPLTWECLRIIPSYVSGTDRQGDSLLPQHLIYWTRVGGK